MAIFAGELTVEGMGFGETGNDLFGTVKLLGLGSDLLVISMSNGSGPENSGQLNFQRSPIFGPLITGPSVFDWVHAGSMVSPVTLMARAASSERSFIT